MWKTTDRYVQQVGSWAGRWAGRPQDPSQRQAGVGGHRFCAWQSLCGVRVVS